jgi:DNA adenine methylase
MKPLFMWAGGKTRVIKHYSQFMPQDFRTYYEPFFGGGAMFVHVMNNYKPDHVVLNDANEGIINIYRAIRSDVGEFINHLESLSAKYIPLNKEDRKKLYYDIRHEHAYNYLSWSPIQEAATLYFLMRTGFNGIWQINKNTNNRFGTPSGLLNQKDVIYDIEVVRWWHHALQNVIIARGDWRDVCSDDPTGFFFFDPPYRDSFADYGNAFDDDALTDLIDFADRQEQVFICNRADDDYFDNIFNSLNVHYFDITYTAGRRKRTDQGHAAKKAREILLYKVKRNNPLMDSLQGVPLAAQQGDNPVMISATKQRT